MSLDLETIYGLLPEVPHAGRRVAETLDDLLTPAEQARLQALRDSLAAGEGLDTAQQEELLLLERKRLRGPLQALLTVSSPSRSRDSKRTSTSSTTTSSSRRVPSGWSLHRRPGGISATRPTTSEAAGERSGRRRRHDPLQTAQGDRGRAGSAGRRHHHVGCRRRRVLPPAGDDPIPQPHPKLDHHGTVNLRRVDQLEALGTAFDRLSHTADVRRIATRGGRYNIPNLGIFLWRRHHGGSRTRPPLGSTHAVTCSVRWAPTRSSSTWPSGTSRSHSWPGRSTCRCRSPAVRCGGHSGSSSGLAAACRSRWAAGAGIRRRRGLRSVGHRTDPDTSGWHHMAQTKVAVDPVLGRIVFPADTTDAVLVTFHYGFIADIGGGEYDRGAMEALPQPVRDVPASRATIAQALGDVAGPARWRSRAAARIRRRPCSQRPRMRGSSCGPRTEGARS